MSASKHLCLAGAWYFLAVGPLHGQNYDTLSSPDPDELILALFEQQEANIRYDEFYESLLQFYQRPIHLNRASAEDLRGLYLLSDHQIFQLLNYRERTGPFLSIYELQSVPGFTYSDIERILPFVAVPNDPTQSAQAFRHHALERHFFLARAYRTLDQKKGYSPPDTLSDGSLTQRYRGSPWKVYGRYLWYRPERLSIGLTFEKDAGERFLFSRRDKIYGFDYLSGHVSWKNKSGSVHLLVGDYLVQSGQGLVAGGGFAPGKGGETIQTTRRAGWGIRPYTGALESGFWRGGAISITKDRWKVTGAVSRNARDARLLTDTISGETQALNLRETGLHRTVSEWQGRRANREWTGLIQGSYFTRKQNFRAGFSYLYHRLNIPLTQQEDPIYRFRFTGREQQLASIHYQWYTGNLSLYGEAARRFPHGVAVTQGAMVHLSRQLETAVIWRYYSRDFANPYANGFSESSQHNNEYGMYWGLAWKITPELKLSSYIDIYRFPWLRSRSYAPSWGQDALFRADYRKKRAWRMMFQIRIRKRTENDEQRPLPDQHQINGFQYTFQFRSSPKKTWQFQTRWQGSRWDSGDLIQGMSLAQDIIVKPKRWPITLSGRVALFDTDTYQARQYMYERDLRYVYRYAAYYGKGMRYYFMSSFQVFRACTIQFKYAATHWLDRDSSGSGLEEIQGASRRDISLQLIYSFE